MRSGSCRLNCSFSVRCAGSLLANTTSPDVSRSMRWTTNGRRVRGGGSRPQVLEHRGASKRRRTAAAPPAVPAACSRRSAHRPRRRSAARLVAERLRPLGAARTIGHSRTMSPADSRSRRRSSVTSRSLRNTLPRSSAAAARARDPSRSAAAEKLVEPDAGVFRAEGPLRHTDQNCGSWRHAGA